MVAYADSCLSECLCSLLEDLTAFQLYDLKKSKLNYSETEPDPEQASWNTWSLLLLQLGLTIHLQFSLTMKMKNEILKEKMFDYATKREFAG